MAHDLHYRKEVCDALFFQWKMIGQHCMYHLEVLKTNFKKLRFFKLLLLFIGRLTRCTNNQSGRTSVDQFIVYLFMYLLFIASSFFWTGKCFNDTLITQHSHVQTTLCVLRHMTESCPDVMTLHGSWRWRRWRLRQYCSRKKMFPSSEKIASPVWIYLRRCKRQIHFPSASRGAWQRAPLFVATTRETKSRPAQGLKKCLCSSRLWTSSPGPVHPGRPAGTRMTSSDRSLSSATWNWG